MVGRRLYKVNIEEYSSGYEGPYYREVREWVQTDGDLVGSRSLADPDVHLPVLDIDFPAKLVPSGTPGHYHLYLEKPMPWRKYKRMLRALKRAGIIEPGFYKMACRRRETFVRVPEKPKPFTPDLIIYEDGSAWRRPNLAPRMPVRFSRY